MRIAGLDVAFQNDYMALVIVEKSSDKKIRLVHLAVWKKVEWHIWKEDMKSKYKQYNFWRVYADQTNNQSVVMELQELGLYPIGVSFTNTSKRDMAQHLSNLLITGELVLPVSDRISSPVQRELFEELLAELSEQEFEHDSSNPKLFHPTGRHDDLLWALCLAVSGASREIEPGVRMLAPTPD